MDPLDALWSALKYIAIVGGGVLVLVWLAQCDVGPPAEWGFAPPANACKVD